MHMLNMRERDQPRGTSTRSNQLHRFQSGLGILELKTPEQLTVIVAINFIRLLAVTIH